MDAYHGHLHLVAKVVVISRMFTKTPCSTEGVQVGQKGMSESTLFFDILEMDLIFFIASYDKFKTP